MAVSRNPVPEGPRQQAFGTKVWNAGLAKYPLSRLAARLKMTKNRNADGGGSRDRHLPVTWPM